MKVGDRVKVSGKTWTAEGVVIGFAKDDPTVPWIDCAEHGTWDARDLGSVREAPSGGGTCHFKAFGVYACTKDEGHEGEHLCASGGGGEG